MHHPRPDRRLVFATLALGLVAALAGCATKNAAWVHENLEHTENFHAGTSVLETPPFETAKPHRATLRATARARGPRIGADIELAVRAQLEDFSFLDRVSFSTSSKRAFPVQVVKREPVDCGTTDVSLCDVYEYVTIKLSRDFLKARRTTGFHAKFWGRRDSVLVHVPPQYIEGLLARMENRPPVSVTNEPVPAAPAP